MLCFVEFSSSQGRAGRGDLWNGPHFEMEMKRQTKWMFGLPTRLLCFVSSACCNFEERASKEQLNSVHRTTTRYVQFGDCNKIFSSDGLLHACRRFGGLMPCMSSFGLNGTCF